MLNACLLGAGAEPGSPGGLGEDTARRQDGRSGASCPGFSLAPLVLPAAQLRASESLSLLFLLSNKDRMGACLTGVI